MYISIIPMAGNRKMKNLVFLVLETDVESTWSFSMKLAGFNKIYAVIVDESIAFNNHCD